MVSRRNFFSITLIMLVVVFMFQVPEIIKNRVNNYGENEYEEAAGSAFTAQSVHLPSASDAKKSARFVVYIGDEEDGSVGGMVKQWSLYTKSYLKSCKSVAEYVPDKANLPEAVLVDTAYLDMDKDISK